MLDDGAGDGEFVWGRRGRGAGGGDERLEDGILGSSVRTWGVEHGDGRRGELTIMEVFQDEVCEWSYEEAVRKVESQACERG